MNLNPATAFDQTCRPFEDGGLIVRLYYRAEDDSSQIFIRTLRPARAKKDCYLPLISIKLERSGPCLKLMRLDVSGESREL